jgi:hypothetical protein
MRRHPYAFLNEIEGNVQELLDAKAIEPATSSSASRQEEGWYMALLCRLSEAE